jgi:hypothetical protein
VFFHNNIRPTLGLTIYRAVGGLKGTLAYILASRAVFSFNGGSSPFNSGSSPYIGGSLSFISGSSPYIGGSLTFIGGSSPYIGGSLSFIGDSFFSFNGVSSPSHGGSFSFNGGSFSFTGAVFPSTFSLGGSKNDFTFGESAGSSEHASQGYEQRSYTVVQEF